MNLQLIFQIIIIYWFFSGEIPATFKQFFAATLALKYLNLSHCKLPIDALKHLLLGLACNEATSDVELNISNNNIGAAGEIINTGFLLLLGINTGSPKIGLFQLKWILLRNTLLSNINTTGCP